MASGVELSNPTVLHFTRMHQAKKEIVQPKQHKLENQRFNRKSTYQGWRRQKKRRPYHHNNIFIIYQCN